MKNSKTLKISLAALFAAIIFLGTMYLRIPFPFMENGYVNLGDSFILLAALMLGPIYGGLAAGIGAALADLLSGFTVYAPATFVIKFLMAAVAFFIFAAMKKAMKKHIVIPTVISALAAEIIMIGGYFLYELILYKLEGALPGLAGNGLQGAGSIIIGTIIYNTLYRTKVIDKLNNMITK